MSLPADLPPDADRDVQIAAHRTRIARFLAGLGTEGTADEAHISLIARGPESAPVLALIEAAPDLARAGVTVRIVLGSIEPDADFSGLVTALATLPHHQRETESIRHIKNSRLLDAHEQMTLGTGIGWIGDAMRRAPNKRDAFDLVKTGEDHVRLGILAFAALWAAAAPLPARRAKSRPAAAVNAAAHAYSFAAAGLFRIQSLRH